eukprot:CAMPEP_0201591008 /NCGR_PEP_ID=MMETSP0190_2-20130828/184395_1 /ASSEMBLY_ACC=CAM_ASM_000263 /TAXON_ID=37353 /ORGANISM="Rosalina sp." /LENGTH=101 /DNA_ID=CAMNT_0048048343 /DNA_START=41 /DNA_END=342 /DNA_ORIENTATION=+
MIKVPAMMIIYKVYLFVIVVSFSNVFFSSISLLLTYTISRSAVVDIDAPVNVFSSGDAVGLLDIGIGIGRWVGFLVGSDVGSVVGSSDISNLHGLGSFGDG